MAVVVAAVALVITVSSGFIWEKGMYLWLDSGERSFFLPREDKLPPASHIGSLLLALAARASKSQNSIMMPLVLRNGSICCSSCGRRFITAKRIFLARHPHSVVVIARDRHSLPSKLLLIKANPTLILGLEVQFKAQLSSVCLSLVRLFLYRLYGRCNVKRSSLTL